MDLEARSLPASAKAGLLAKLREYKSDLTNLKSEVKRITSGNSNQATGEDLLESGMADTLACLVCERQGTIKMIPGHGAPLSFANIQDHTFSTLMLFECSGMVLAGFSPRSAGLSPRSGWKALYGSGAEVMIDFSEGEFAGEDELYGYPIGISNFRSEFVRLWKKKTGKYVSSEGTGI